MMGVDRMGGETAYDTEFGGNVERSVNVIPTTVQSRNPRTHQYEPTDPLPHLVIPPGFDLPILRPYRRISAIPGKPFQLGIRPPIRSPPHLDLHLLTPTRTSTLRNLPRPRPCRTRPTPKSTHQDRLPPHLSQRGDMRVKEPPLFVDIRPHLVPHRPAEIRMSSRLLLNANDQRFPRVRMEEIGNVL